MKTKWITLIFVLFTTVIYLNPLNKIFLWIVLLHIDFLLYKIYTGFLS